MSNTLLNIGIIIGSTRKGRVSPQVAQWVKEFADNKGDANYEIVDIRDYHLPLLGEPGDTSGVKKWNDKIASLDGFIFITSEYNHGMAASLKNAIDYDYVNWNNKAAGIVSYGSAGGARSAEQLRSVLSELQIAHVRTHVLLSTFIDFEKGTTFKPKEYHAANLTTLLDQLNAWGKALKTLR